MVTALVAGVPAVTPVGSVAPKLSLTLSPSSSTVSVGGGEGEGLGGVAAAEGHVLRHAGVVGGGGAALVGLLYGDDDCALGVRAEGDGHLDGVLRYVGGIRVVALGHGVGGAPEAHGDGRNVVVGDGDGARGRRPCGDAGRQRGPEAQLHALAVVVDGVVGGGEGEGLGGVAAVEGHVLRHAGVVGGGGAALVGLLYGDDDCALGIGAEGDGHLDGVLRYVEGIRVVALGHGVGGAPEAHRDGRYVVVGDGDRGLVRRPRRDAIRQRGPEAQLDALAVVVDGVGLGGEDEGLLGVPAAEGHARRHARVVGGGGPALVGLRYGDDHHALGVGVQGDGHLDGVLRYVGGIRVVALGHGVGGAPEADGDGGRGVVGHGDGKVLREVGVVASRGGVSQDLRLVVGVAVVAGLHRHRLRRAPVGRGEGQRVAVARRGPGDGEVRPAMPADAHGDGVGGLGGQLHRVADTGVVALRHGEGSR